VLAEQLWPARTAVLTSATIPPGAGARLGLPAASSRQLEVASPFDYRANALLYVPAHLPPPTSAGYEAAMIAELELLVGAAGGRTLGLFTSWRAMDAAAAALRDRLPWRLLTQAELAKPALLAAFRDDETSCLFATLGFWQGVDIPGPALSLVTIDRIPFPRPDEPLHQARRERAGPGAFTTVDLPRAATLLAQGAGRLVRSIGDRGVVAVLDSRLATRDYRRELLRLVPPMRRTVTFSEVESFLGPARLGQTRQ
ncbi:MAG: ATP-dependent DNA helicase, partial [Acidimicrobiales bacterium]